MEFSLPRTVSVLERTPGVLDTQLTDGNYGDGMWSAYEVVWPWRDYINTLPAG